MNTSKNTCEKECNKCNECRYINKKKKPIQSKNNNKIVVVAEPIRMSVSSQIGGPPSILQQLLDFQKIGIPVSNFTPINYPLPVPETNQPPNPVVDNIVNEQNNINRQAKPLAPSNIMPSSSPYQGFAQNQEVNQLNRKTLNDFDAIQDFGGNDAYRMKPRDEPDFRSQAGESVLFSDRRHPSALSKLELDALDFYEMTRPNKKDRRKFDEDDKELYNLGKKISMKQNKERK